MRCPSCVLLVLIVVIPCTAASGADREGVELGNFVDQRYVAGNILVLDEGLNRRVSEIGNRVAGPSGRSDLKFTFRIINDPEVKAYATAGGYVYIHTGLLDVLDNSDELAAIIAHEVAHISEDHLVDRLHGEHSKRILGAVGGVIGGFSVAVLAAAAQQEMAPGTQNAVPPELLMQLGARVGADIAETSIKGFHESTEHDADRVSLTYLRDSGYDPYALARTFVVLKNVQTEMEQGERTKYTTALLNKEPGLDARLKRVETILARMGIPKPPQRREGSQ